MRSDERLAAAQLDGEAARQREVRRRDGWPGPRGWLVMRAFAWASLTFAIACGGKTRSVAGSGGSGSVSDARAGSSGAEAGAPAGGAVGAVDAGGADNGQGGAPCPLACPDPFSSIFVVVTADGGGPVNDAQATLINAVQGAPVSVVMLSCTAQATRTVCLPALSTAPPGEYLLEVTAPSFQGNVDAVRLVWLPPNHCGCAFAVLQPATVTLLPQYP